MGTREVSKTGYREWYSPRGARRWMCETNPIEGSADRQAGQTGRAAFGIRSQRENRFHVTEVDPAEVAFHPFDGPANQSAGRCEGKIAKGGDRDEDGTL